MMALCRVGSLLYMASRSITSRRSISSSSNILPQAASASKVSGLSQSPKIIVALPASIRLAIAISPSRDRSSTLPISRRYILTGSSVRSIGALASAFNATPTFFSLVVFFFGFTSSISASALSITFIPISESIVITFSICSEDI